MGEGKKVEWTGDVRRVEGEAKKLSKEEWLERLREELRQTLNSEVRVENTKVIGLVVPQIAWRLWGELSEEAKGYYKRIFLEALANAKAVERPTIQLVIPPRSSVEVGEDIDYLKERVEYLEREVRGLREENKKLMRENRELWKKLEGGGEGRSEELEEELEGLREKYDALREFFESIRGDAIELAKGVKTILEELRDEKVEIGKTVRYIELYLQPIAKRVLERLEG